MCLYNSVAAFHVRQELNSYISYISDEFYASNVYKMIFFKKRLVLLQKVDYSMYIILIVLKLFL